MNYVITGSIPASALFAILADKLPEVATAKPSPKKSSKSKAK